MVGLALLTIAYSYLGIKSYYFSKSSSINYLNSNPLPNIHHMKSSFTLLLLVLFIGLMYTAVTYRDHSAVLDHPISLQETYQIILDSFVLHKYSSSYPDGRKITGYSCPLPSLHVGFQSQRHGHLSSFREDTEILGCVEEGEHTFSTQGWDIGTFQYDDHYYDVYLQHKYFGGDAILHKIEGFNLGPHDSPFYVESPDGLFAVSIYYHPYRK